MALWWQNGRSGDATLVGDALRFKVRCVNNAIASKNLKKKNTVTCSASDAIATDTIDEVAVPSAAADGQSAAIEDFRPQRDAEEIDDDGEPIATDDNNSAEEEATADAEDVADESEADATDDDAPMSSIFPKMPSFAVGKMPAFFPMNFGRTSGGAIAVANSYSKHGTAISHAVAHGSPATRRQQQRPAAGKPVPTV